LVSIQNFFSEENKWIRDRILEEPNTFHKSLKPLAEHYIRKRLIFSGDEDGVIRLDPKLGLPTRNFIPQVVFWLAEAFGFKEREVSKRLALGLVYSSLAFAVVDDTIEQEIQSASKNLALINIYLHKYLKSFDGLFEPDSKFWHYLAFSIKEFAILVYQDYTFKHEPKQITILDPLSEPFLLESCKSYSVLVMTTFAALAYASNNENKIPLLTKFWNNYAMGHRIYDDLNDLHKDLRMSDYNNSSVLLYALKKVDNKIKLDEELVWSMLLDTEFIDKIYNTMLCFFRRAKEDALDFNSSFLNTFMDELISAHVEKRDNLLQIKSNFYKEINKILKI
jgi:hypothetical protein